MVRAKTDAEKGVKRGELYFDGRLNTKINTDPNINFKSSGLKIHSLFGKGTNQFINTENSADYIEPIVVTKEVSESFSFLDEAAHPYLYDMSTGMEVKLAKKGEDPHGIMLPYDFKYPVEKTCIKDAYKDFNNWVNKDPKKDKGVLSTNWYTKPVNGKVYTK